MRVSYAALAITDECSVAGVVRVAGQVGLEIAAVAEFAVQEGFKFRGIGGMTSWLGHLCEFISAARGRGALRHVLCVVA